MTEVAAPDRPAPPPASGPSRPDAGLEYAFGAPPDVSTWIEVAPGVRWVRMRLPFALDHINLWLLAGPDGWTHVDCGIADDATRAAWEPLLAVHTPVVRVVATHHHPDHVGLAGWLVERAGGVPLWMTEGEYLTAHAILAEQPGYAPEPMAALFLRHGLTPARAEAGRERRGGYGRIVGPLPPAFARLMDGDAVRLGHHNWEVIAGFGHCPEHAALYCQALGVLISGDMLLPRISTNVSVWPVEPEADPVGRFLRSLQRYRVLPPDTLVLPSHGLPFRGIATRIDTLEAHHAERFAELLAALDTPKSAADVLPVLFRRTLDAHQLVFAMGEAIGHLNHLHQRGDATRVEGPDGVLRFVAR
ncbi:MAG: MBL fold metallo-hydrolase [Burkholderiales bacterium]|nr:MBL fold metallo-hydrolase [Burkholderiales bacterium]